jgi:hypothetical protein
MATELDHNAIKARIVAILKANTSLYTTTAEANELRAITVGHPQGDELQDQMFPYAFVTNSAEFESITNLGVVTGNAIKALQHTFHYDIVTVVNEEDARHAEVQLDLYQKLILQTLEADSDLRGTGSAVVDISFPVRVQHFRPDTAGQGKRGRRITLRCVMTTK